MKIYYVGDLYSVKLKNETIDTDITIEYRKYFDFERINSFQSKLTDKEFAKFKTIQKWKNIRDGITDTELQQIIDKVFTDFSKENCVFEEQIVFELIEDKNGNFYGKEILTGLLFPLIKNPVFSKYTYNVNYNSSYVRKTSIYLDGNLVRTGSILDMNSIATVNYIEKYNTKNNGDNKTKFFNNLKKLYNENVFKNEIIEKIKEPTLEQSELTKLLEQIEYLLCLLKQHSKDEYTKFKKIYDEIFLNKDEKFKNFSKPSYRNPTRNELMDLISNIKFSLIICEKKCNNPIDYINALIEDYLNKILNNNIQITDINICDLDNLTNMFLKNKDEYNLQQQRTGLRKISILYLLVVKHNIDTLTEEHLKNSYFKDNLKSIILNINTLHELGIFKNSVTIYSDDILTIPYVLNLIKSIEFNKFDTVNVKRLVK